MASKNQFTYTKTTLENIGRSVFDLSHRVTYDCEHGDIVPVGVYEVIPGDVFSWKVNTFVRTATPPIAPIMSNIYASIAAFFVPKRLLYSKVKEFYGENVEGYGIQSEVTEPTISSDYIPGFDESNGSIARYFSTVSFGGDDDAGTEDLNLLPFRAFYQVVNDWFLNENFSPKYLWDHDSDTDSKIAVCNGDDVTLYSNLPKCLKKLDRFTSCLPWAQKASDPVSIGLSGFAPVGSRNPDPKADQGLTDMLYLHGKEGVADVSLMEESSMSLFDRPGDDPMDSYLLDGNNDPVYTNLFADLSKATAVTINQLRLSIALQRYYEALARGGSKYREILLSMFGVRVSDTTAQMAEYLGGISFMLNIAQVLQTAGYEAGSTTKLAAPGAVSCTRTDDYLFNKGFEEPGYIVLVQYTKHQRTYGTGIPDMFLKKEIWDYYNPKFAHCGEVPIKSLLVHAYFNSNKYFGFQEYGSEYRSYLDRVLNNLNPAYNGSLDFWTLSENFGENPVDLTLSFLTEDRAAIARCLAGGENGPDYFFDIYNVVKATRSMPVHSIPGLMDHF